MKLLRSDCIFHLLNSLGLASFDTIYVYHPRTRDHDNICVMRCRESGVIFLSSTGHINSDYYSSMKDLSYWIDGAGIEKALEDQLEDTKRRGIMLESKVINKRWLDVGAGLGGTINQLAKVAKVAEIVEPQIEARRYLSKLGFSVYDRIECVPDRYYDIITLFHVFEHVTDPMAMLAVIRSKLDVEGRLIIEVPHARDILISSEALPEFNDFTFWSEHLILHTKESLRKTLEYAGFNEIKVYGVQRYSYANHAHWFLKKRPGGHIEWKSIRIRLLEKLYESLLICADRTDTLIATAVK